MSKGIIARFMKEREVYTDREFFMSTLAYHLAPVIHCEKPSTILTFNTHKRNMYELWQEYKYEFKSDTAISFFELKQTEDKIHVLFFIPCILHNRLIAPESQQFLKSHGYEDSYQLQDYLKTLKERYEHVCPHEIGLFLGVPLKDVCSFIEKEGKNYLHCGYWKVYHELEDNIKLFARYDQSKIDMIHKVKRGNYQELLVS